MIDNLIETQEIMKKLNLIHQEQIKIKNYLDIFIPDQICFSDLYNKYRVHRNTANSFLSHFPPEQINKKGGKIYIDKSLAFEFIQRYSNDKKN